MFLKKKKQSNSLAYKVSTQIKGKILAAAFVDVRREGLLLRVATIDGKPVQFPLQETCINVDVVDGFVKRSWID